MKRTVAILVALILLVPTVCWSKSKSLKENIDKIADVNLSEIIENGHLSSALLKVTMVDGKEFVIAVGVDKKNFISTFTFASGKSVIVSPLGIEVLKGEGYQYYDDIDNTVNFEPHQSRACLINLIAYWFLPSPLDLLALFYMFQTCL